MDGKFLHAKSIKNYATVGAIAIDDNPLQESNRILLLHLTDVKVEGVKYGSPEMRLILEEQPNGQLLAKKGTVELTLSIHGDTWKLYALNLNGKRLAEVPFHQTAAGITFTADTHLLDGEVVFAYELTREKR